jgi:uncharacterized SAM-binding protein YcdF (DUF218 family)
MGRGGTLFHRRRDPQVLAGMGRVLGRLMVLGAALFAAWLAGLAWYSAAMPDRVEDAATHTDAIVVLTGGSERLRAGLDLLGRGLGDVLFISGVHPATTLEALLAEAGPVDEPTRSRITLGRVAMDTVGNAIETAVWMEDGGLRSLRLVTASYHMPRALMEFRSALPAATIIPHPVFPPNVKQKAWWEFPGTAALFASEYTKYLIARLRLLLPDAPARWSPRAPVEAAPAA